MKKLLFLFSFISIVVLSFGQQKKIEIMPGVFMQTNWGDSIKTDTYYDFQLIGNKGRIANVKVKLKYGILEQLKDNNYRVKLNPNDEILEIIFNKYDPMSKQKQELKRINVPVKK